MVNQDSRGNSTLFQSQTWNKIYPVPERKGDFYTLFQSQRSKNHTLLSGTYPYSPYMGVPPPPPPGRKQNMKQKCQTPNRKPCRPNDLYTFAMLQSYGYIQLQTPYNNKTWNKLEVKQVGRPNLKRKCRPVNPALWRESSLSFRGICSAGELRVLISTIDGCWLVSSKQMITAGERKWQLGWADVRGGETRDEP